MHVAVLGAGLMGITSAYFLRRAGCDVTVVDRAAGAARETSFANASMLTPSMSDPWNSPGVLWKIIGWMGDEQAPILLRPKAIPSLLCWGTRFIVNSRHPRYWRAVEANLALCRHSIDVMRSLRSEHGLRYDQSLGGTLRIFRRRASLDAAVDMAQYLERRGLHSRVLGPVETLQMEPSLAGCAADIVGGVHYPADEVGDAFKFCGELQRLAEALGARFRFGANVARLERTGSRLKALMLESGESIPADVFVLAAGSYSPELARQLGVALPVRPVKGYSITLPAGSWAGRPQLPVLDDDLHAAVVPLGDRLRVAGTAEITGYDRSIPAGRIENLWKLLVRVFPEAGRVLDRQKLEQWAGLRPMCPDGVPVIDRSPLDNLYINSGHGHLGWTMAAGSGQVLADLVAGRVPAIDGGPYRLQRFARL